jgi:hypothetical protein
MEEKMKLFKGISGVLVAVAVSTVFMACASSKKNAKGDEADPGFGENLTLTAIEREAEFGKDVADLQFYISKRVLLQFDEKLPDLPKGLSKGKRGSNTHVWRGVVVNRGTQGIAHPKGSAVREEEGMKVIRVLFGNKDSEYLEFGAFLDEPDSKFELITDPTGKVPFGMLELLRDLEALMGLSWSGDEPQFTASYKGVLPYLQFIPTGSTKTAKDIEVLSKPDRETKVDRNAFKVQGRTVGSTPKK